MSYPASADLGWLGLYKPSVCVGAGVPEETGPQTVSGCLLVEAGSEDHQIPADAKGAHTLYTLLLLLSVQNFNNSSHMGPQISMKLYNRIHDTSLIISLFELFLITFRLLDLFSLNICQINKKEKTA